jgi:hypothetical protein
MNQLDVIGDIHGKRAALERLLTRLGYENLSGVWRHPGGRRAVFVGDIVDRGEDIPGSLKLVKAMVDHGEAFVVLGNHEYGLLAWYTRNPDGEPRKKHRPHYLSYMEASVRHFDAHPDDREVYLAWFRAMPLTLAIGGARFVHAYWDEAAVAAGGVGRHLDDHGWSEPRFPKRKKERVDLLIKGPETNLPEGVCLVDRQGISRTRARISWWLVHQARDLRALMRPDSPDLEGVPVPDKLRRYPPPDRDEPPLFFGHYGFRACPGLLGPNFTCVDFQGEQADQIGAYRWSGEATLHPENLVITRN